VKKQAARMLELFVDELGESVLLNGDRDRRLAGNLNVCFHGTEGKAIINSVSKDIAISSGSACTTKSVEPSHVIMALGFDEQRAHSSIRIGIGRFNRPDQTEFAARKIIGSVKDISLATLGGKSKHA